MNKIAKRAGILMLFMLILIAGFTFFVCEYVTRAGDWVLFPGSPHIYQNGNINCGTVVDRDGAILLKMEQGNRVYSANSVLRKATLHWIGDRYGYISATAVPHYAAQMAGFDLLNGTYSYANQGGVASLTLSSRVQMAALEAMGSYKGTVAVYNYKTGELICAVTTPNYDPDQIPDMSNDTAGIYEGIYWNRFTQSTYTPGSIFKIVTAAAALETRPELQDQLFTCTGSYELQGEYITCESAHYTQDLKQAFCNSCNCAFAQIAIELGPDVMERYAKSFGITQPITFDGITTAAGNFEASDALLNLGWSAVGQYRDQINPCTFLTFIGAVANGGKGVKPYLVDRITVGENTTYQAKSQSMDRIMSSAAAELIAEYMRNNVQTKYGDENFPGLTVCAKTGTAEVDGGNKPNAMLAGFVSDEQYPLAFVVCVEDGGYGRQVCVPIASKVLAACKEILDQV